MTSARAYDGGFWTPYSETPIYDRLVAERGRPDTAPIHVPTPDFAGGGLGGHPLFSDRPALPALPALPSSYQAPPQAAYGQGTYGANSGQYPANNAGPTQHMPLPRVPQPAPVQHLPAPMQPAAPYGHQQVPAPRIPGAGDPMQGRY